jgi:hypothetical protein
MSCPFWLSSDLLSSTRRTIPDLGASSMVVDHLLLLRTIKPSHRTFTSQCYVISDSVVTTSPPSTSEGFYTWGDSKM